MHKICGDESESSVTSEECPRASRSRQVYYSIQDTPRLSNHKWIAEFCQSVIFTRHLILSSVKNFCACSPGPNRHSRYFASTLRYRCSLSFSSKSSKPVHRREWQSTVQHSSFNTSPSVQLHANFKVSAVVSLWHLPD